MSISFASKERGEVAQRVCFAPLGDLARLGTSLVKPVAVCATVRFTAARPGLQVPGFQRRQKMNCG